MNFSDAGFFAVVGGLLLLSLVGLAYLHRDKLKAAWADYRAPKLDEAFVKLHGEAIIRSFQDHLKPLEEKAAAAMSRANAAVTMATGTAPLATDNDVDAIARAIAQMSALTRTADKTASAAPAASPPAVAPPEPSADRGGPDEPKAKESDMDKGIVTVAQLLAGWVLPDSEANPPVQGVPAKRHADIMYLTKMIKRPGGNNVFEDVITGSQESINVVKNYAHTVGANVDWADDGTPMNWAALADPRIVDAAEASIAAYQAAHPRNVHVYDFSKYRHA